MELNRLVRLIRARWWWFAIVAGAGLVSGFAFTSVRNDQIRPEFSATASAIVDRDEGSTDRDFEAKVIGALDLAIEVNEADLNPTRDKIQVDTEDQEAINFTAVRRTEEEASTRATEMRRLFLDQAVSVFNAESGQVDVRVAEIDFRLGEIETELRDLQESMRIRPPRGSEATVALLQNQLAAVEGNLSSRYSERLLGPDTTVDLTRTAEDVEEEIAVLEEAARALRLEIDGLQPEVQPTPNPLTRQVAQLEAEYASLLDESNILKLTEAAVGVRAFGTLESEDQTSSTSSPVLNAVLGLFAGALVAFGLVVTEDRYRQIVWVGSDLRSMPLLGEVAARRTAVVPGQPWYELGGPPARKRAVQAIRVTVEGAVSGASSTLAFIGMSTPSSDVHELAADFAMSMVTSGGRVLLVDADFDKPSDLVEFSGEGSTLSDMLSYRMDDEESYRSFVKRTVTEPAEVHPGLTSIQVGRGLA
ncbi:MAG TPA: hypothetical protein ENH15_04740, partial [Actinobacteria bacterium]|nr:hypothetical protein [Actinomycetota bacterium]